MIASNEYQKKQQKSTDGWLESGITRRVFVKTTGLLATGVAVGTSLFVEDQAKAENFGNPALIDTDPRVEIKYSVCLNCQGG